MGKIKRKVEMTLPELIEWAWENEVSDKAFIAILMVVLCISIKFKICR